VVISYIFCPMITGKSISSQGGKSRRVRYVGELTDNYSAASSGQPPFKTERTRTVQIFSSDEGRIFVRFPYDPEINTELKKIVGHRWHPAEKYWSFSSSISNYTRLLKIFEGKGVEIDPNLKSRFGADKESEEAMQVKPKVIDDVERLSQLMRVRNYSNKTIKSYCSCIRHFGDYGVSRQMEHATPEEIRGYLFHLVNNEGYSPTSLNQVINALRFLYVDVFNKSFILGKVPRPRKERKLPDVLTKDEVRDVLHSTSNPKHRLLLMLIYSAGLRVGEASRLRLEDIDARRKMIHLRAAKGKKDRYTLLSERAMDELREYLKVYKPIKYVFEGEHAGKPLGIRSMERVFERAGIKKHVSVHTLRHSFAAHLLEQGTDLRHIQVLLGHASSKMTEIYTHVSKRAIEGIHNPLDDIEL